MTPEIKNPVWKLILLYATGIVLLLILALISGCKVGYEKQKIRAEKFYLENPNDLALQCASKYPPKTEYVKGETIVRSDTVVRNDTVVVTIYKEGKVEYIKVPCPTCKEITKYVNQTDTVKVEDEAKLALLRNDNTKLAQSLDNEKKVSEKALNSRNTWMWISIGIGVAFLGTVAFLVLRK